jgi:5-methylcytosine-specific restriction endonuclease McrA
MPKQPRSPDDNRPARKRGGYRTTRMTPKTKHKKREALLARDGDLCYYCERQFSEELPPTFEHLVSLKDGGTDKLENLVLACWPCNNARANDPTWTPGEIPVLKDTWQRGCKVGKGAKTPGPRRPTPGTPRTS